MHELKHMRNTTEIRIKIYIDTKELFNLRHSMLEKHSTHDKYASLIAKEIKKKTKEILQFTLN